MNQQQLPTDRSIELEDPQRACAFAPANTRVTSQSLFARKMAHHLQFMQAEFLRNLEWQRHLLEQIAAQESHSNKHKSKHEEGRCLLLDVEQQNVLRSVLEKVLGQPTQHFALKELIKETAQRINKMAVLPLPQKLKPQPLDFPVLQRVVTLNDLAGSTQKEIAASPSLPPRTPKTKCLQAHYQAQHEERFLSPFQNQSSRELSSNRGQKVKGKTEFKENQNIRKGKELHLMQDSLGKRLFQQQKGRLIFIEDFPQGDIVSSQVSLTLSMSNNDKKRCLLPLANRQNSCNESPIQTEQILQTLYMKVVDQSEQVKRKQRQVEPAQNAALCFAGSPKRRIGKYMAKKESSFAHDECEGKKLKKMLDSFGQDYQEYYYEATSFGERQEGIYCRRKA